MSDTEDEAVRRLRPDFTDARGTTPRRHPDLVWQSAAGLATNRRRRARSQALGAGALIAVVAVAGISLATVSTAGHGRPSSQRDAAGSRVTISSPTISSPASAPRPPVAGSLVFLGGKNLEGQALSSTHVESTSASAETAATSARAPVASRAITSGPPDSVYYAPQVSPNAAMIVYVSGTAEHVGRFAGQGNIGVSASDGTGARLISNTNSDSNPVWSPDSSMIAFLRHGSIWTMKADGTNPRHVGGLAGGHSIAWSPDGRLIAESYGDGPSRIAVLTITTGTSRTITPDGLEQYDPSWSPDGSKFAYGQSGANGLFVSNVDGTHPRQVTTCTAPCTQDIQPAWSPDGKSIAFTRALLEGSTQSLQIFVVRSVGGTANQVTAGLDSHQFASWS